MKAPHKHNFRPLLPDPARSPTLPGYFYSDPNIFVAEQHHIFRKQWQLVAHETELKQRGSFLCTHIADEHIIIIRGQDDVIRGFYNVCSHRAHELLAGSGCVKSLIICPYHAWTFNTQGELHGARYSDHMPDFDKADYGLTSVRVETMMGFVFANLDPHAPSLESVAGEMFADMQAQIPWWEELTVASDISTQSWEGSELNANWKVLAENCLECYHCAVAHPAFVDLIDLGSYVCQPHGTWLRSYGKLRKLKNKAYDVDPSEPAQNAIFWHLWPNCEFNVVPGEASMGAFRFSPTSPHTTRMTSLMLTRPGEGIKPERLDYRWNILWPEDKALCESVHRGLQSQGYRQGRFVIDPTNEGISEHAVHNFQLRYAEAIGLQ